MLLLSLLLISLLLVLWCSSTAAVVAGLLSLLSVGIVAFVGAVVSFLLDVVVVVVSRGVGWKGRWCRWNIVRVVFWYLYWEIFGESLLNDGLMVFVLSGCFLGCIGVFG